MALELAMSLELAMDAVGSDLTTEAGAGAGADE